MRTASIAALVAASLALAGLSVNGAHAQSAPNTNPSGTSDRNKQLPWTPFIVNGETFLRVNLAQLLDGRTAASMNVDGDWITVTSREAKFIPRVVGSIERKVPKNPEIASSLKIMQIYYVPTGDSRLNYFDGHYFTACSPAPQGDKSDEIKYPATDNWNGPGKLEKNFIGFKMDPKHECGAAIWMIVVRAPEGWQTKPEDFEHLLVAAGNRLALNLQHARELLYDLRWMPHNGNVSGADLAEHLFQPFHDAATDCLLALGVDSTEQPKSAGFWARFRMKIFDFVEGRSSKPRNPVTSPAVIAAMTHVYLNANFLVAELEDTNQPSVQPAIDHLKRISDDINHALGFNRQGPGTSRSYYAVMDNAAWVLNQLADDHPYLGLTPQESNYLRQMTELAEEIRQNAQKDGDTVAAEYVRQDFANAWSGPKSEVFRHVLTKLFANKSESAIEMQNQIVRLADALRDKCDQSCKDQFAVARGAS